jgi:hypothetical protein
VATPDASRNIAYKFPAATFRNAMRFVFEMAADPDTDNQLMFHFSTAITFLGHSDGDKVPFDPNSSVTRVVKDPVKVPCDVQFITASDVPTSFGLVVPAKLKVTLLDEDFALVENAVYVTMNGDRYNRLIVPPSYGLFDVGLHEMVFQAENET